MYITASSSASSILRASSSYLRTRIVSPSLSRTLVASSPPKAYRSLNFSSAVRSLRFSAPRWSHGVDWRSPISLRSQIRAVAPVIEQFQRKISTMGTVSKLCSFPKISERFFSFLKFLDWVDLWCVLLCLRPEKRERNETFPVLQSQLCWAEL
jgi:hypothetical protein